MNLKCSRCGKHLEDFMIRLETKVIPNKITECGLLDPISNLMEGTSEILCEDCFNMYCDCLNQLNSKLEEERLNNIVDIVDDVQYDF